jgi:hypothetical protein
MEAQYRLSKTRFHTLHDAGARQAYTYSGALSEKITHITYCYYYRTFKLQAFVVADDHPPI